MHASHISYTAYAFSGPRKLTSEQHERVDLFLEEFPLSEWKKPCLVGDANGVDRIVRNSICSSIIFEVQGNKPSDYARRTLRMIDALAEYKKPCLYVFPSKPCPEGCYPRKNPSGKGSGTWLAAAAARHRGIAIKIVKLDYFELPNWLYDNQISLF